MFYIEIEAIMMGSLKLNTLDVSTGALGSLDDATTEEFTALFDEHQEYGARAVSPAMRSDYGVEERLIFCFSNGIFEYSNSKVRKTVDAEGTILADLLISATGYVFINQDDFVLLADDIYNYDTIFDASDLPEDAKPSALYKYEKT